MGYRAAASGIEMAEGSAIYAAESEAAVPIMATLL
jgi:hypothetical protein